MIILKFVDITLLECSTRTAMTVPILRKVCIEYDGVCTVNHRQAQNLVGYCKRYHMKDLPLGNGQAKVWVLYICSKYLKHKAFI